MKKIINVTICIFTLFSTKVFSQDFDENDFFCCSVYELYKTSTENDVNNIIVKDTQDNDEETIYIEADENKLRQVLINIFDNSKDALKKIKKPEVIVSLTQQKDKVVIIIQDNGIGIPQDIINRIYEPYVTSKDNGTGLGLAIVNKIIEEHNGTIKIENRIKDGVKITIMLPNKK